ncbi:N-acetylglucosamine-6-phosphate deacetylase [Falsigemmobacter faecalis]|uniref:N-acetylglucosamine-6-phosphate deacetylase n=1 Tax=Falsigemmobacter faecalis TaxID=2488730 RepID=A0A3P3DLP3_9RHOB|nr:N-acetylglucosamine-6-phosphate deacetylase [Falsigemmobacter faecalis]RRH75160.1 N-acetylglucosamine-6-phosphate deacetylase [Falsigemmobacter faecalis]
MDRFALIAPRLFDGERFHEDVVVQIEAGRITALSDRSGSLPELRAEGLVTPGMVDLQVNGGGGEMLGPRTDAAQIARLLATHARLGATSILPTLITDSPEVTARVIEAGLACRDLPGFLGLHLEGPHLDPARKGAHDPALIRPMTEADLTRLLAAAAALPALMVTLAPGAATSEQISRLAAGGVIVALGHSDCSFEAAEAATRAGARCATHLFNAMSQPQGRAPGLAGAVLAGSLCAGLIADGHHVSIPMMQIALRARPRGIYLVSDAMAVAGTPDLSFTLNGRKVLRQDGRLTLSDGTLAGADITLPESVAVLSREAGIDPARALAMATSVPADLLRAKAGRIAAGHPADLLTLSPEGRLGAVWKNGTRLT